MVISNLHTPSAGPTNSIGGGEAGPQPASNPGVVAAAVLITLIIVVALVMILAFAGVIICVSIRNSCLSKKVNSFATVRQVTREGTKTVNQLSVNETMAKELVQTFTKNEAYVTQESAVISRNEAYTTLPQPPVND